MSTEKRDFYEVLGVSRTASGEEVRTAFKRLAMEFHPDRNPGNQAAEERFKEVAEAYDVLSDPEKRTRYDHFGHGQQGFDPFSGFGGAATINDIFGEIFGEVFGAHRRGQRRSRGADLRYNLELDLEQAAFGATSRIEIQRPKRCETCHGSGAKPGTHPRQCPTCGGTGEIRLQQGFFAMSRTCGQCRGEGKVITDRCTVCGGAGGVAEKSAVDVRVPPGVDSGTRLKLRGEGEPSPSPSGEAGDLYVVIQVRDHPIFQRQDTEVVCELPISIAQAALGTAVDVPTLDGPQKLKIPAGTQPGKTFRLKGKGIAPLGGGSRGDQHVRVQVEIPTRLTKEQRELLEKFAALSGEETNPAQSRFWSKVSEILGKE
jgi:molecular chaperone DnaJ